MVRNALTGRRAGRAAVRLLVCAIACAARARGADISNGVVTLRVSVAEGRARRVEIADANGMQAGELTVGPSADTDAACAVETRADGGTITFSEFASADARNAVPGPGSTVRIDLLPGDAYPKLTLDIVPASVSLETRAPGDGPAAPPVLLACSVPAAPVFYRGGFLSPMPVDDPFPISSPALRGQGPGSRFADIPFVALPVPALGLWHPETGAFAGFEAHEDRLGPQGAKDLLTVCRADAASSWAGIAMPTVRTIAAMRLVWGTALRLPGSPNELVLSRIRERDGDRLAPAPPVPDLGWLPPRRDFVPDDRTEARILQPIRPDLDPEALLFADGTKRMEAGFREILNLLSGPDTVRQDALMQDWAEVLAAASGADPGVFALRFPAAGGYRPEFGGGPAGTVNHLGTWQAGAVALALYATTGEERHARVADAVLARSARQPVTRAGSPALPGCASVRSAAVGCLEFLLPYARLFAADPGRAPRAEEALALARSLVYRHLAVYLADPDHTDADDPTFLLQDGNETAAFGTAGWRYTDAFLVAVALCAVETGDDFLAYVARGSLARRPEGCEADPRQTAERLRVSRSLGGEPGARAGRIETDDCLAEVLQPIGPARLRVVCGRRAALACGDATVPQPVGYAADGLGNCRFSIAPADMPPFDLILTMPMHDLRGKPVTVNGRPAAASVAGTHGENVVVRGVRPGDSIAIGALVPKDTPGGTPTSPGLRPGAGEIDDGYVLLPTPGPVPLDRSWPAGRWAGLPEGVLYAYGIPFAPGVGGEGVLALSPATPVRIPVGRSAGMLCVFADTAAAPTFSARICYAGGNTETVEVAEGLAARSSPSLARWRIDVFAIRPRDPGRLIEALELQGTGTVLALTTHPSEPPGATGALAAARNRREADRTRVREAGKRLDADTDLAADLKRAVADATRGKILRIAFLPPHEAYTDDLTGVTAMLGVPPTLLSPDELVDPEQFNARRYPIAVHSAPETFLYTVNRPGDGADALKRYLAEGGCLVLADYGYPVFYPHRRVGNASERIPDQPTAATCAELHLPIAFGEVPPPESEPRCVPAPGQTAFPGLSGPFPFDRAAGGPLRPLALTGVPPGDTIRPILELKDRDGTSHGLLAGEVVHGCPEFRGGRVVFLWGNMLRTRSGSSLGRQLMAHAIRTTDLQDAPPASPAVAVLPPDRAGRDDLIRSAVREAGADTRFLTLQEFADPAVFNARNFPVAIHAVGAEFYPDDTPYGKNLWQAYVAYVRGGGVLLACGNMWQFYYAGTIDAQGGYRQVHDAGQRVLEGLGLVGNTATVQDDRPMVLRARDGQDVLRLPDPMPIQGIYWGSYRSISGAETFGVEFTPVAELVDDAGNSFGGWIVARQAFTDRKMGGAEVLWFWGNLLDDPKTHPLFAQIVRYACERRRLQLGPPPP